MELFALLLPIGIDYINRKINNSDIRLWVSVGVCAIFALGLTWIDTSFKFATPRLGFDYISAQIMIAFGLAQLSFKAVWEKTTIHKELRVEAKQD